MIKHINILIIVMVISAGCQNRKNADTTTENLEPIAIINADTIDIDLSKSVITWIGRKPTGSHDGTLSLTEGLMLLSNDSLVGGAAKIDMTSVTVMDIKNEESNLKLKKHLLSDDFFDAERYPEALFQITAIKEYDSTLTNFMIQTPNRNITGNLTIKSVTRTVSFPARVSRDKGFIKVEAKFTIDRTQWGITYREEAGVTDIAKDKFIYDEVKVGFLAVARLE